MPTSIVAARIVLGRDHAPQLACGVALHTYLNYRSTEALTTYACCRQHFPAPQPYAVVYREDRELPQTQAVSN